MRRTRHVFGIGDTRHKARCKQPATIDSPVAPASTTSTRTAPAERTSTRLFSGSVGSVNRRRFLLARERIDAFRSRSRRCGARIANGHICRFLRTQHNCTLSLLRTNPLHAQPVTCS